MPECELQVETFLVTTELEALGFQFIPSWGEPEAQANPDSS